MVSNTLILFGEKLSQAGSLKLFFPPSDPTVAEGKLTIPPGTTIIEEKAYENRTDIREVIIPDSRY